MGDVRLNPAFYQENEPAAVRARRQDDRFFADNPTAVWRVRPLYEGESTLVDGLRHRTGWRGYAVVIEHGRAGDRRKAAGRGIYPVVLADTDRPRAVRALKSEAQRMVRWFRKSSSTPPPARAGRAVLM